MWEEWGREGAAPRENRATTTRAIARATILVGSGWPTLLLGDSAFGRPPSARVWRGGGGEVGDGESRKDGAQIC